jgi:hypothetical protein
MVVLGIICLLIGVFILYRRIKFPVSDDDGAINLKGYASGVLFILIGIYIIIDNFDII